MSKLIKHIQHGHARPIKFAGDTWLLDGKGCIVNLAHQTLIVSDLHFEKASYLNHYGNVLPTLDTFDTLKRLAELIDFYSPQRVVCLGDSFHDVRALDRMAETDLATLTALAEQVECWVWVQGNHDPDLPEWLTGDIVDSLTLGEARLLHEPDAHISAPQIVGHFHPKLTVKTAGRKVTGKCVVASSSLMILPSFGSYTGGLGVNDKAITSLFGQQSVNYHLLRKEKVWPIKP
ncbi:ligase-associated DNA damage response endonuclease PdeM [Aestuariibacter salexigens]|uniref:ligase-associated DNA damage response endonuclease PdeM n=1 Tax=Aestuariibacter salexigens TaxID=226010 RepID=UPI0004204DAC|nr:ligase-associated DNA damage response endonuclease PdeM [Aestuariibacter salexigens]